MSFKSVFIKAELTQNIELGKDYYVSWFNAPEIIKTISPGQFVMMESGQYLLRPFSVYEIKNNNIGFLYRVIGGGTSFLSKLKIGDKVSIHGPLGKGFSLPENKQKPILIIAGGIGIATFPLVARIAHEKGYKVKTLFGARSVNDLVCAEELKKYGELESITDDGSSGKKGFVTELLTNELKKNKDQEIFVCGPTPMLKSVIKVCNEFGVIAQVSFEEFMACGYGVCMSCVIMANGKYVRTCKEGPVMKSDVVAV
ncbi:MAG: dihydroorotate dehydrogenase electron transfer subunit [Candidatus Melainabacteria bacterium]|nr:dihydroorotate dehydrogenase electron transfer subunit [Candidatus Melainabacteria bacterium]